MIGMVGPAGMPDARWQMPDVKMPIPDASYDASDATCQMSMSLAVYASSMMNLNRASGSLPIRSLTVRSV